LLQTPAFWLAHRVLQTNPGHPPANASVDQTDARKARGKTSDEVGE
jgi:hypothetical protein